uniref:Uncharacterized protein n=1 Tax=Triticum urartu TaxID=4572 RepID=A0A8R7RAY7_TRIUA
MRRHTPCISPPYIVCFSIFAPFICFYHLAFGRLADMDRAESSSHNSVGRKRHPSLPNPPPRVNPYVAAQNRRVRLELMVQKGKR